MVCCVAIIGMDNLALMNLRISEVFCLTQKVVCRSANTGAYHRYLPVTQKAPIKKCYNLGSSYPVMGKMSTQTLHLAMWSEIILVTCSVMYGTGRMAVLSAFVPNYCAVIHCTIDSTTFFSYQNINRIFILCKSTCYTIIFIAHRFTELIYRTTILSVVLCGCETWSLTFRVEGRLRVFENRVLRRIFGPKRGEERGEWRRLHNEELNDL